MKILLINGPNLNMLGKRDHKYYGKQTLKEIVKRTKNRAEELGVSIVSYQSNHEGDLIDFLQKESALADAIIINAGALTHYSYALYDALKDTTLPVVEVHISDITKRETWRKTSVIASLAIKRVIGKKGDGYIQALDYLVNHKSKFT